MRQWHTVRHVGQVSSGSYGAYKWYGYGSSCGLPGPCSKQLSFRRTCYGEHNLVPNMTFQYIHSARFYKRQAVRDIKNILVLVQVQGHAYSLNLKIYFNIYICIKGGGGRDM